MSPKINVAPKVRLAVRLAPEIKTALEVEAARKYLTLAELVRAILERAVRGEGTAVDHVVRSTRR